MEIFINVRRYELLKLLDDDEILIDVISVFSFEDIDEFLELKYWKNDMKFYTHCFENKFDVASAIYNSNKKFSLTDEYIKFDENDNLITLKDYELLFFLRSYKHDIVNYLLSNRLDEYVFKNLPKQIKDIIRRK